MEFWTAKKQKPEQAAQKPRVSESKIAALETAFDATIGAKLFWVFLEWHPWHRQRPLQVTLQILCFKLHFYENFSEKPCHRSHKKQKVDTTHSPALYPQRSVAGRSKNPCHTQATRATAT